MIISVIIPTHNPDRGRLRRTLEGLGRQTLPAASWELLLIDNASTVPLSAGLFSEADTTEGRIVREPEMGLTAARRCGFRTAQGDLLVLVDDDNVLAPDYLEHVVRIFGENSRLGAAGGRSLPEFEVPPPVWIKEFLGLLACRDFGEHVQIASGFCEESPRSYPVCAPIGAGMAIRRQALAAWLEQGAGSLLSDRRGGELSSGGDNDISLAILGGGWSAGYFPELTLTHLIPAGRLRPEYLQRLNRGIATSWIQVLSQHGCNPWPAIPRWTLPLRKLKAWFSYRAWAGEVERIRWQGACGHFEGRARNRNHV